MIKPRFDTGTQEARDRALQGAMTLRRALVKELPENYDVEILAAITRRLNKGKGRCMVTVRSITGHVLQKLGLEREDRGHNMMKAAYYMTSMLLEELGGIHDMTTFRHNTKDDHTNYGSRVYKLELDWWESA